MNKEIQDVIIPRKITLLITYSLFVHKKETTSHEMPSYNFSNSHHIDFTSKTDYNVFAIVGRKKRWLC